MELPLPRSRFAKLFKAKREEQGLRQEDAAELLGVTQPTISGWEHGRTLPSPSLLPRIVTLLKIDSADMAAAYFGSDDTEAGETGEVAVG